MSVADAVRQIGVTVQTYYRWRRLYGGMGRDQLRRLKELEKENQRLRRAVSDLTLDELILGGSREGKLRSPLSLGPMAHQWLTPRAAGVASKACGRRLACPFFCKPGRRACRTLGQHRSTQRKAPRGRFDEVLLTEDIIELARDYGRYGYRMVAIGSAIGPSDNGDGLLNNAGWHVNHKRVERIWRREGLKIPQKQPKKGRLWLNDGSCVRLRPERPNHVWSYDFVQDRTHDGRVFRTLNSEPWCAIGSSTMASDEYTKEALMIRVDRKLNSVDVVDALTDLFILRGPPEHIRSDNGPEFVAEKVRSWITAVGARTAFIEPGSPWENGYCESFNARFRARFRDELLNGEIFLSLREAQILIEQWRRHYNTVRPHSALGYRPPAPDSFIPMDQKPIMH